MPVWLKDPCERRAAGPSRSRRVKNPDVPRVKGLEWRGLRNLGGTTGFLRPISGGGGLFFCASMVCRAPFSIAVNSLEK